MHFSYKQIPYIFFIAIILAGCCRKPKNLTKAKEHVEHYYEDGCYEHDVQKAVDKAIKYFTNRVSCGPQSAVVFDIDDTLLWSYYDMKSIQFGYVPPLYHKWVMRANSPAVPHVKRLYDFFVRCGCKIILLTGRRFDEREATLKNLQDLGFDHIDLLIMRKQHELMHTALEYKSKHRKLLTQEGYRIIATIGDQYSDLEGGYAFYKVKIPNYTYILY